MDRLVCQKLIAEELNLSQSTVSLALRDRPGVNKDTAAKVKAAAERLGYVPDPMLASLAEYRNRQRPSTFRSVLPWLHADENLGAHREDLPWGQILTGARERAERLGFKLEPSWIGETEHSPESFARMLKARGVSGAICGPSTMNTNWLRLFTEADLPIVCVGTYSFGDVKLVHVSADHYQNARTLAQDLEQRGYKKVLVILNTQLEVMLMRQYTSLFQRLAVETDRPTKWQLQMFENNETTSVGQRILREKPDAIVLQGFDQYRFFEQNLSKKARSYLRKKPLGLLCDSAQVRHPAGQISIDERLHQIGGACIDQLSTLISSWKLEGAGVTRRVLIEGRLLETPASGEAATHFW